MKYDTRIEIVALVAGAMAVSGWFGMKAIFGRSSSAPAAETAAVTTQPVEQAAAQTPPARTEQRVTPAAQQIATAAAPPTTIPARRIVAAGLGTPTAATETPPAQAPGNREPALEPIDAQKLADAKRLIAQDKRYEARLLLTQLILKAPEGEGRNEIKRLLDEVNAVLFFSRAPSPDSEMYEIRPGDALSRLAIKAGKDTYFSECIMKVNGITDAKRIRAGQKIKIPAGKFSARVQRGPRRIIILLDGQYIKEYPITTGAPVSPTPLGQFIISNNKMVKPAWSAPDGNVYQYGDPKNILGTRWLGIEEKTEVYKGYGIHGTSDPDSIGKSASNGCVRMLNPDVEEVFGMLSPGDAVDVVQ